MLQSQNYKLDNLLKLNTVQSQEEPLLEVDFPLKESKDVDALELVLQDPEKERKIVSRLHLSFNLIEHFGEI